MASPGNPTPPGGGPPPFDMHHHKLLPISNPNPQNSFPNFNNNNNNIPNSNSNPNLASAASYPPPSFPPQTSAFHHYHHHPVYPPPPPPYSPTEFAANLHPQRSMSYPTPPLQPQVQSPHNHQQQNPTTTTAANPGARLMALLSAPAAAANMEAAQQQLPPVVSQIHPTASGGSDISASVGVGGGGLVMSSHQGPVMRMPSSKLPKGRHLVGDRLVYDVNVRYPGEVQPQLEVTPITKYGSDPGLVLGRQIAVNKTYICYGLKLGAIRVLNINTALRSLLKGLAQRVTDMAFFAEDVHLLASASVDGRVYVWKITEGPDEEDKPQITGKIVIALQITGEGESVHPRVCWHCHKQEVLVVGIGRRVLRIDTTKVGKGEKFSAEEPLKCPIDKLIDGVQLVGSHDGEVTDLSMCQWMTTRLVSASVDGTIKIWEDRKSMPIAVLQPHDGQPVNSVTFLAAPDRPDHIILITGGPLNREMKIWVSASEEGWLLPSDAESWNCTQTLELKSSEAQLEEAFFNQVVALSQSGLLLLANAKRNAIYAVHLEYGPNPAATRMDYISEYTVTMPILSFTGTSELLPHGEQIVQVYCVQTQAIQQYALDLSQCLPPPMENVVYEKSDASVLRDAGAVEGLANVEPSGSKPLETYVSSSAPKASINESGLENPPTARYPVSNASTELPSPQEFASSTVGSNPVLSTVVNDSDISSVTSPPLPLSPRVSRTLSGYRSSSSSFDHGPSSDRGAELKTVEYSVDRQIDDIHANLSDVAQLDDENKSSQADMSMALNNTIKFKHPTHLVTPSEILMANSSPEVTLTNEPRSEGELNSQDVLNRNDSRNVEVEVKVVGETRFNQDTDVGMQEEIPTFVSENKDRAFCSQVSDLGIEMARESRALSPETYSMEEARQFNGTIGNDTVAQASTVEEVHESAKDVSRKVIDSSNSVLAQQPPPAPNSKGKKQKSKNAQGSGPSSPSASAFNSADSSTEPGISSGVPAVETAFSQIASMQETLNQLVNMQKEMQKQIAMMVAVPVTKEGKRVEAALGKSMEKAVKANTDALWARFQEENAKQDKAARERSQQISSMISNCFNKDLPAVIEKTFKRELTALGQSVARSITPIMEKTISTSVAECFQKGIGDKAVNQLDKSVNTKLEATVARQIQAQFQTSGKQALQETLRSSLEASVIPAFEMSCRAMFDQVDSTFQKGMVEHTAAAQQQFESSHSPLALALRDALNSASSVTQTLSSEVLDGQRKLLALAVAGGTSKVANPLISQLSNGPLGGLHEKLEAPLDPTKELSRLIAERKYEEAFTAALQRSDVNIVSWLCAQVDLPGMLSVNPLPLSQGVLLSLLQQLACDMTKETPRKLTWMREVLSAVNPTDPMIVMHVRPIFEQVYQILNHHRNLPTTSGTELSNIRLIMHVINSMLMSSK